MTGSPLGPLRVTPIVRERRVEAGGGREGGLADRGLVGLEGGVARPGARDRLDQQPVAGEQAHLHERQAHHEQERQHERELDRPCQLPAARCAVRPPSALPVTLSMMSSKNAGSLPTSFAQAISTTATAAAARITSAYSAVVWPSS